MKILHFQSLLLKLKKERKKVLISPASYVTPRPTPHIFVQTCVKKQTAEYCQILLEEGMQYDVDLNCAQYSAQVFFIIQSFRNFHKAVQTAATRRENPSLTISHHNVRVSSRPTKAGKVCKADNQSQRRRKLTTVNSYQTVNLTEMTKSREDNQLQTSQGSWQRCDFGTFL